MTRNQDRELLEAQLREALSAQDSDPSTRRGAPDDQTVPFEIAVLAGLLARYEPQPGWAQCGAAPLLAQARLSQGALAVAAEEASLQEVAQEQVQRLGAIAADEDPGAVERTDALLDLDEFCAGAWFCGRGEDVAGAADLAARCIEAFPLAWRELSDLAAAVLEQCPPLPGDPARLLWRALLGTQWSAEEQEAPVPACLEARGALKLPPRVSRRDLGAAPGPLLAAGDLPPVPPLLPLLTGPGFELALGQSPGEGQVLLLRAGAASGPSLERDGVQVPLRELAHGLWSGSAEPGVYRLVLQGAEHLCEVES